MEAGLLQQRTTVAATGSDRGQIAFQPHRTAPEFAGSPIETTCSGWYGCFGAHQSAIDVFSLAQMNRTCAHSSIGPT